MAKHPRSLRKDVMVATQTTVADFHTAVMCLGLVSVFKSQVQLWSLPSDDVAIRRYNNIMAAPAYVEPAHTAPRAGSLAYKEVKSLGIKG